MKISNEFWIKLLTIIEIYTVFYPKRIKGLGIIGYEIGYSSKEVYFRADFNTISVDISTKINSCSVPEM